MYIYCLKHPKTFQVFYIGQTKNLFNRLSHHFLECYKGTHPKDEILRLLKKEGISPVIEKIEELEYDRSFASKEKINLRERYWISYYNKQSTVVNIDGNIPKSDLAKKLNRAFDDIVNKIKIKKCILKDCGRSFEPKKPKQIYCSSKCRTYAFRERLADKKINKPNE